MHNRLTQLAMALATFGALACSDDVADSTMQSPVGASGASGSSGHVALPTGHPALDFSRFDAALESAIAEHNASAGEDKQIRGASAVVVHEQHGTVHVKGYGAYAADRLYLIASSSKILSVGVLMRLADQGKLDIDAPIGTYLDGWGQTKASQVSVAQLVSNSSGLPSLSEVSGAATNPMSPFVSNLCQYTDQGTLQDCAKNLYQTDPPRPPDTMFAYGGSQWQLAGAVAEVVSGQRWAELIEDTYVTACDVPTLGYTNQFGKGGTSYPAFFMGDKANLPVTDNPSIEGGAYIKASDYGKLLLMQLRGGTCEGTRVLSESAVARMQANRIAQYGGTTGNPNQPGYGLGFWVNEAEHVVTDAGAYGSFPLLDLVRRYGVFIVIEVTSDVGVKLGAKVKPALDAIFDEVAP